MRLLNSSFVFREGSKTLINSASWVSNLGGEFFFSLLVLVTLRIVFKLIQYALKNCDHDGKSRN